MDIHIVTHEVVDVPGLHSVRSLILADAESTLPPEAFPAYNSAEIARLFLFSRRWPPIKKWPPKDHPMYSSPPTGHGLSQKGTRYSLPAVEKLLHYWFEIGEIQFQKFIFGIQIVAWTARGWGLAA